MQGVNVPRLMRTLCHPLAKTRPLFVALMLAWPLLSPESQAKPVSEATVAEFIDTLRAQALVQIKAGKPELALQLIAIHEAAYVGEPDFDYLLGTTALAAGRNALALIALERVVLVQPSFAGAWLDLAIAHFRLGELETAESMLIHVKENFTPPHKLRAEIDDVLRRVSRARMTKGVQAEIGLFSGRTSNANYGLAVSSLQLNFYGAPVSVPLDASYQPRADSFSEVRATVVQRLEHAGSQRGEVSGALRYRRHADETAYDQRDVNISGIWRWPMTWSANDKAHLFTGGSLRDINNGGRSLQIGQLSGGIGLTRGVCQLRGRLDYEHRLYAAASEYDAAIPWLGVSADCERGPVQYGSQLRLGRDVAINDRPGADTVRSEAVLFGRWQVRPGLQLGALAVFTHGRDTAPYSPLLAEGDPRWVRRFGKKLEALWVPGANPRSPWAIVIEFETLRDSSNIGLSSLNLSQFLIGLNFRYF